MYVPMPITDIALLLRHGMLYKKLVPSVTKMLDHYNCILRLWTRFRATKKRQDQYHNQSCRYTNSLKTPVNQPFSGLSLSLRLHTQRACAD